MVLLASSSDACNWLMCCFCTAFSSSRRRIFSRSCCSRSLEEVSFPVSSLRHFGEGTMLLIRWRRKTGIVKIVWWELSFAADAVR